MKKDTGALFLLMCWHEFAWLLQNALIHGLQNSWFQTLHSTMNGEIVFRLIIMFVVQSESRNPPKLEPQ